MSSMRQVATINGEQQWFANIQTSGTNITVSINEAYQLINALDKQHQELTKVVQDAPEGTPDEAIQMFYETLHRLGERAESLRLLIEREKDEQLRLTEGVVWMNEDDWNAKKESK